jgi:hypothetical protein
VDLLSQEGCVDPGVALTRDVELVVEHLGPVVVPVAQGSEGVDTL